MFESSDLTNLNGGGEAQGGRVCLSNQPPDQLLIVYDILPILLFILDINQQLEMPPTVLLFDLVY